MLTRSRLILLRCRGCLPLRAFDDLFRLLKARVLCGFSGFLVCGFHRFIGFLVFGVRLFTQLLQYGVGLHCFTLFLPFFGCCLRGQGGLRWVVLIEIVLYLLLPFLLPVTCMLIRFYEVWIILYEAAFYLFFLPFFYRQYGRIIKHNNLTSINHIIFYRPSIHIVNDSIISLTL